MLRGPTVWLAALIGGAIASGQGGNTYYVGVAGLSPIPSF